jgi:hypothetical protein
MGASFTVKCPPISVAWLAAGDTTVTLDRDPVSGSVQAFTKDGVALTVSSVTGRAIVVATHDTQAPTSSTACSSPCCSPSPRAGASSATPTSAPIPSCCAKCDVDDVQHFATMAAPAAFDPVTHARLDLAWRSLVIQGSEGQSTVVQAEIENPQQGLLAAGRDLYAQLSLTRAGTVHQYFSGRFVAVPNGFAGDFLTATLDCRFGDLATSIEAAVSPLRVTPGWDALFVDPNRLTDPMEVLEGYHAHLFIDPRSQAIRVSDALFGSAVSTTSLTPANAARTLTVPAGLAFAVGVRVRVWYRKDFTQYFAGPITAYSGTSMTVTADEHAGSTARADWVISLDVRAQDLDVDSVQVSADHKPFTALTTVIEAQWTQTKQGDVDLTDAIKAAAGSPNIRTLSIEEDFAQAWPAVGDSINGNSGYTVKTSALDKQPGSEFSTGVRTNTLSFANFPIYTYKPALEVSYDLQQKRVETATFTLAGNAQAVLADTSQADILEFHLQDVGPELPTPAHATFFNTDRGREALDHGIQRTRVQMAESQRCVQLVGTIPGMTLEALYMTTDHTVCMHSPKLPGGLAIGKVSDFTKTFGEDARSCAFTLKASIGKGYTLPATSSDDDYVDDGYWADDYIGDGGGVVNTGGPNPVGYETYGDQGPVDGLKDFVHWAPADFITTLTIGPQVEDQLAYLNAHAFAAAGAWSGRHQPARSRRDAARQAEMRPGDGAGEPRLAGRDQHGLRDHHVRRLWAAGHDRSGGGVNIREEVEISPPRPKKASYVGAPACFALELACKHLRDAFGAGRGGIYQVGSSLSRADWRDIDVRYILPDEEFAKLFPNAEQHWEHDPRWLVMVTAISAWLSKETGLPIDFQFQPQSHANERHKGNRNALGMSFAPESRP